MTERIKRFVIEYLEQEYTIPDTEDIDSLNYVAGGYVSSLGIVQFIMSIEDEFGIEFSDEELGSEEIKTVGGIVHMISAKLGS